MTRTTNAVAEAVTSMLDGGFLQVYAGETMLAQMRFSDPAFATVRDGFAVAREIMVGTGRADGVADQWVALSAGGTPVLAGEVGGDMLLNQTYIATGAEVRITSFTYRQTPL